MGKEGSYYILTLPLCTQQWQEHILEKRYSIGEHVYNAMLKKAYQRYLQMCQTRQYRELSHQLEIISDVKARKQIYHSLDQLARQYELGKYELSRDATSYRNYFKENIDSPVSQNLSANVWKAIQMLLTGKGKKISYKKPGDLLVLSAKTNATSIRYRDGKIHWKGLIIPVKFHKNSDYETKAMKNELRFCRLKRQSRHGCWHYYVDLVFAGHPPRKTDTYIVKEGKVGIDVGLRQLAVVTPNEVTEAPLADIYARYQVEIARLDRYMDHSRRMNHPQNYDEQGKMLPQTLIWNYSNKYKKARQKRKELFRTMTEVRIQHYCILSKQLLQMGNEIFVENLSFSQMMRRYVSSNSEKRTHRFYGKQILRTAPATLLRILQNKLEATGGTLHRLNPAILKAGGFNHIDGNYTKQPVKKLWKTIGTHQIRRNFYTAFLIMNAEEKSNTINLTECIKNFDRFIQNCQKYQDKLAEDACILRAG